jgi:putative colanic acid biosynthesis glycosyltransferase
MPHRRIAVVTVCLNDLPGLKLTFESLRIQTQLPQQWIVADGASRDGTPDWLRTLNFPLLAWTSEPDGGIYDAMNKGLERADADYVLFLNSGDVLATPDVLDVVSNALAGCADQPSLLYGDCFEVDERGVNHLRRARPAWWVPVGMPTCHQAMLFRMDAIKDGFDTRYRLHGDYAAVSALYKRVRGQDFEHIQIPLCRFKLGGRSDQQARALLRESFEIRRRVLGMAVAPALILHALHGLHALIKRYVPMLHRLVRYG